MSTEKKIRLDLRMSEEDQRRLKELAAKMECSESYAIRQAIKEMFERVVTPKNRERTPEMKDDFFIERRRAQG